MIGSNVYKSLFFSSLTIPSVSLFRDYSTQLYVNSETVLCKYRKTAIAGASSGPSLMNVVELNRFPVAPIFIRCVTLMRPGCGRDIRGQNGGRTLAKLKHPFIQKMGTLINEINGATLFSHFWQVITNRF